MWHSAAIIASSGLEESDTEGPYFSREEIGVLKKFHVMFQSKGLPGQSVLEAKSACYEY
jgi:hypothetical protein